MWRAPCSAVFIFVPPLKTLATFSYSPHLSLRRPHPPLRDMTAWTYTTSLVSSPVSEMKAFLCRQTSLTPFPSAWPRPALPLLVALFGCIFWFIYTSLIVAPRARHESQRRHLACTFCRPSQIRIWNIHECMNIFIVEKPLCIRESLISCRGPALEWSGMIPEGAPHAATK